MAATAHINHFHSATRTGESGKGFFARLMTRIALNSEARAIHRLETEAAHLLGSDHMRQIKADFAARKTRALS